MWICPLNGKTDCSQLHAINTADGGLKHYESRMAQELGRLGWKHVNYPKRSYYYEEDRSHPSFKEKEQIDLEDNTDILKVEII